MKKISGLFILVFAFSCKSPERLLQQGDYDAVIDKQIKIILRGKAKNEDIALFDKSYKLANERDQSRIDFLVRERRPENWEEIYHLFVMLDSRQNKVQTVLPISSGGRNINYPKVDYSFKIVEAKKNAAKYYYESGLKQMEMYNKEGYRQAYYSFLKVNEFRPGDYPDLTTLLNDSRYLGTSRVLIQFEIPQYIRLPRGFYDEISRQNVMELSSSWVEYHTARMDKDTEFDYLITFYLKKAVVTPPSVEREEFLRRKQIEEGFEKVKDAQGNILKDSLGKEITRPKYRYISCNLTETRQFMSATVEGELEFMSLNPRRILRSEPVAGTSIFENVYARSSGNRDALLPEDIELIRHEEIPFPSDVSLLMDCAPVLRHAIDDALRNNRNLIY